MKPTRFEYHDPRTLTEAVDLLGDLGDGARLLAGGQSLVPLMNLRLVRPSHLIDLNRVNELRYLEMKNGELKIGAMTRQRELERSTVVEERCPILYDATRYIGHVQVRNRGTIGGSLAHAFPSAELPVVMIALDASLILRKKNDERSVSANEFFLTYMTTVLEPDELLAEIRIPLLPQSTGWSFQEVSRRHGDFALAGVAALIDLDERGVIREARLAFTGPTPTRAYKSEACLVGQEPAEAIFREAARLATANLEQDSDIHASADYRRRACEVLARRTLREAGHRASGKSGA